MKKAISAQGTKMFLENPGAAPIATGLLTAGSASKPCVVTFDNVTKMANGEPLYTTGSGWTSIDDQEWVIQNLDKTAKTASLANSDTSGETTVWNATASYTLNAFGDVCAQSYQINQNPATTIDTTTLCDEEKTSLVGFRDPGTLTFDFFIDPTDPDYLALHEAYDDGEERMFELIYKNGAVRTLPVIVQSINETGGVDQAVHGSATLKITGSPILTQPGNTTPPVYALTVVVAPAAGAAPLTVTATMTESNGTASQFQIDWGDATAIDTVTGSLTKTHDYAAAGSYTPHVTPSVNSTVLAPVAGTPVTVS
jgi:hypothetical protein